MSVFVERPGHSGRQNLRIVKSLLVVVACGLATTAGVAKEPDEAASTKAPKRKAPAGDVWKIQIIPGPAIGPSPVPKAELAARHAKESQDSKPNPAAAEPAVNTDSVLPAGVTPAAYAEVYNSIPFRRSEYAANRSYRHEATIELLLGQVRPKTVVNVTTPAPSATCCSPPAVSYIGYFNPWGAKSFYYQYHYSRPSSYWYW